MPFQDALIATIAILYNIPVWTRDDHFQLMQTVLPELQLLVVKARRFVFVAGQTEGKNLRSTILSGFLLCLCAGGCSDHVVRTRLLGTPDRIKTIRRVAIPPFECEDKSLGGSLSDAVGAGFMSLGIGIVEREKLAKVIAELDLQSTNLAQQQDFVRSGRLLGADAIMFGSVQMVEAYDFGAHWKVIRTITCRIVDIETGGTLVIMTYSRDTDLSSEGVVDIADRICNDFGKRVKK